jgi:hypothetical protein
VVDGNDVEDDLLDTAGTPFFFKDAVEEGVWCDALALIKDRGVLRDAIFNYLEMCLFSV